MSYETDLLVQRAELTAQVKELEYQLTELNKEHDNATEMIRLADIASRESGRRILTGLEPNYSHYPDSERTISENWLKKVYEREAEERQQKERDLQRELAHKKFLADKAIAAIEAHKKVIQNIERYGHLRPETPQQHADLCDEIKSKLISLFGPRYLIELKLKGAMTWKNWEQLKNLEVKEGVVKKATVVPSIPEND